MALPGFLRFRDGMGLAACVIVVLALPLAGWGGGGGEVSMGSESRLDYSNSATPRYSYTPYETGSHAHSFRPSDDVTEVYFGGDPEPRKSLRHVATTKNGIH